MTNTVTHTCDNDMLSKIILSYLVSRWNTTE